MTTITIPKEYGYVIGSGVLSALVMQFLAGRVGRAREKSGVKYPYLYADQAVAEKDKSKYEFNCIQRGHQNALESYPQFLFMLAFGGIKHPLIASVGALDWCVGRVLYAIGYTEGPDSRYRYGGFLHLAGLLTVLGTSVSTGLSILKLIK